MTNQELSAAIRDLDEQLEEFVRNNDAEWNWVPGITLKYRKGTRICFWCGTDLSKLHPQSNLVPHMTGDCASLGNEEGQAGGVRYEASASAERGESAASGSLRITEVPEPHQPTKWIGWLLVTFAAYCLGLLVWAIVRAK